MNRYLNIVVFHHNDLDGYGAAASVYFGNHKMIERTESYDAMAVQFLECNYNNLKVTESRVAEYISSDSNEGRSLDEVYIVDLSFATAEDFEEVYKILENNPGCKVTWIDHHQASTNVMDTLKADPRFYEYTSSGRLLYIVSEARSGAWHTYVHMFNITDGEIPRAIKLIDDYDRWVHDYEDSKYLNNAFWMYKNGEGLKFPPSDEWFDLLVGYDDVDVLEHPLEEFTTKGKVVAEYRKGLYDSMLKGYGYEAEFEGHKAIVLNSTGNSECFGAAYNEYPLCILWRFDGKKYSYSLYSKPSFGVNCNELANKYGGGGHAGAAGFTSDELIPSLRQGNKPTWKE